MVMAPLTGKHPDPSEELPPLDPEESQRAVEEAERIKRATSSIIKRQHRRSVTRGQIASAIRKAIHPPNDDTSEETPR